MNCVRLISGLSINNTCTSLSFNTLPELVYKPYILKLEFASGQVIQHAVVYFVLVLFKVEYQTVGAKSLFVKTGTLVERVGSVFAVAEQRMSD